MRKKKWRAELSKDAVKYLKKLDKKTEQRIFDRLKEMEKTENPALHKDVRPLTGRLRGFYRLRIAHLRLIFELDVKKKRIGVHIILPRLNAY